MVWNVPNSSIDYSAYLPTTGDINGDGRTDVVLTRGLSSGGTRALVILSNGDGTMQTGISSSPTTTGSYDWKPVSGDFNGDGLMDIAWAGSSSLYGTKVLVSLSNGSTTMQAGTNTHVYNIGDVNYVPLPGDYNGDGVTDIAWVSGAAITSGMTVMVSLSNGDGTMRSVVWNVPKSSGDYSTWTPTTGDFDGDGLTDVVLTKGTSSSGTRVLVILSNGDGTMQTGVTYSPKTSSDYSAYLSTTGDFNGDGVIDVAWTRGTSSSGTRALIALAGASSGPPLREIETGLGAQTAITYKPLTDSSVYTKGIAAVYPEVDIQTALFVASQMSTDNGIGGVLTKNYTYTGLKSDYNWQQLLGFASMKIVDAGTGIQTITNYNQAFPYLGLPALVERRKSNNALFGSVQYSYDGQGAYDCSTINTPVVCRVFEKTYDFDGGAALTEVTTDTDYDSYNNPVTVIVETEDVRTVGGGDIFITERNNTYADNPASLWKFGLLSRQEVQKTLPDLSTSPVSTVAYNYDSNGLLSREIVEPDSTNQNMRLTTAYMRDGFGNITRTTLCDGATTPASCTYTSANARSTQMSYTSNDSSYPNGLFMTGVTNALSQSESRVYNVKFGLMTRLTGPNGLTTEWGYDTLGRKILEHRADGTETEITYTDCTSCPSVESVPPEYTVTTEVTGRAPETVYADALNRPLRKRTTYDGTNYVYIDNKYDARGHVEKVSEPYYSSGTPVWTVYDYDDLGRVVQVDPAHTTELVTTDYNGFSAATTDVEDRVKVQTVNAIGQIVSVTEADGDTEEVTTVYRYDAAGNLEETEVNDDDATIIHMDYDVRGRKTAMDDPDMGEWSYVYNAFGELISQTDAKSQVTQMAYDKIGRMIQRVENATGTPQTSTFTFGTSAVNKNIGKLASMSGPGSSSTSFTYDSQGRPYQTTYNIDTGSFVVTQSYDGTTGMPTVTTYPATTKYSSGFQVRRVYNSSGTLIRVETTDTTPFIFWQADPAYRNARGQVALETLGNGVVVARTFNAATGWLESADASKSSNVIYDTSYTYDDLGNLQNRTDYLPTTDIDEDFTYDALNRLLTFKKNDVLQESYAYDDLGNITSKAGVTLGYTGCGGRPHALCSDGTNSYAYDANGNMTSRGSKTVTYTASNLPYEFKNGSTVLASFAYDAQSNRVLKIAGSLHVRYVGMTGTGNPLFEQEVNGSTTRNIHYIYADGAQAVAQHITIGTSAETQYFHRDHLGSVEATSDDASTPNVDYIGYDAWGRRILSPDAENMRLGFTGHETIQESDLVHMNGRVYDPILARFLSADPNVPDPFSSQSYNRYSYVLNNPLSYTDPNGYLCCDGWEGADEDEIVVYGYADPSTGTAYTMEGTSYTMEGIPIRGGSADNQQQQQPQQSQQNLKEDVEGITVKGIRPNEITFKNHGFSWYSSNPYVINSLINQSEIYNPTADGLFDDALSRGIAKELLKGLLKRAAWLGPLVNAQDVLKRNGFLNHYTNKDGMVGILETGVIFRSLDGNVYLTPNIFASGEAAQSALQINVMPSGYFMVPLSNIDSVSGQGPVPGGNAWEIRVPHDVSIEGARWVPIGP